MHTNPAIVFRMASLAAQYLQQHHRERPFQRDLVLPVRDFLVPTTINNPDIRMTDAGKSFGRITKLTPTGIIGSKYVQ